MQKCPISEVELFNIWLSSEKMSHSAKCTICAVGLDQSYCHRTAVHKHSCSALTKSPELVRSPPGLSQHLLQYMDSREELSHDASLKVGQSLCMDPYETSKEFFQMFP